MHKWMMLLGMMACSGVATEPSGPVFPTPQVDLGSLCLSGGDLEVVHSTCGSACDFVQASCEATLDGTSLEVTSSYSTVANPEIDACPAVCEIDTSVCNPDVDTSLNTVYNGTTRPVSELPDCDELF